MKQDGKTEGRNFIHSEHIVTPKLHFPRVGVMKIHIWLIKFPENPFLKQAKKRKYRQYKMRLEKAFDNINENLSVCLNKLLELHLAMIRN